MAIPGASALSSFDQGGNREDLSDVLASMVEVDVDTALNAIGIKGEATATKHEWVEDALGSVVSSLAAALNTTVTSATVATGDGAKFHIGSLFKIAGNNPEVMQVTAVSTDTLTIVRGYGSTSDPGTNYASGSVIEIISHPAQEDAQFEARAHTIRTKAFNYTQVFFDTVDVSDTQEQVSKAGVDSEVAYQLEKKLLEKKRELNIAAIKGIKSADAGSDSSLRSMGGIVEFISAAGGNAIDAAGAALSKTLLDRALRDVYEDGGEGKLVLAGPIQKPKISEFLKEYRRGDMGDKVGYVVREYDCDFGTVDVRLERYLGNDTVVVLDPARLAVMPLRGCAMYSEDLARTGRSKRKMITGEYTLEVRNATKAHALIYNLATS
ncbi:MAG: SU10 major capsid protein [Minisyncoccota bacterium]